MEIKIKKQKVVIQDEEATISIPYFCKNKEGNKFGKIFGDGTWDAIKVTINTKSYEIEGTLSSIVLGQDYIPCPEQDFLKAFNEASNDLNNKANS